MLDYYQKRMSKSR